MFGLLGPNGAGKTTLMRILAGILRANAGQIQVGSYDLQSIRGREGVKTILGYLPQELGIYPDLSAFEFLDYIGTFKGLTDRTIRKAQVKQLLELAGLTEVADRKLRSFSGGMKRRVGIAQALLNNPKLLIVDEPTAGLDPEERIRFRNLLAQLAGDRIVLLSTHIVEDIAQTCYRLAVMKQGQVVFQGTINELATLASGHVWDITTTGGNLPTGDIAIVSTISKGLSTTYHLVGTLKTQPGMNCVSGEPRLEDGYMWLMHEQNIVSTKTSKDLPASRTKKG